MSTNQLVYIASPYNSPDPKVREERYYAAIACVNYFLDEGTITPFSPILYGREFNMGANCANWDHLRRGMLYHSDRVWVLRLPGFEESTEVHAEIEYAKREYLGIPIAFLDPDTYAQENWCQRCAAWAGNRDERCTRCRRRCVSGFIPGQADF